MNSRNKLLTVIVFVILIASIIAGVLLVKNNQNISEKAAPTTNLSFSPASSNVIKGQSFTTNIVTSTGSNIVTGFDIELTYNPAAIHLTSLTPTQALSNFTNPALGQVIRNEIDNTTGKARFIAYILNKDLGLSGQHNVLLVSGNALTTAQAANYQISYSAITSIAAKNEIQNALLGKTAFSLTVVSSTPSPSPSNLPSSSPSISPSPSPTSPSTSLPQGYNNWDVDQNGTINVVDIGLVVDDYGSLNPVKPRADVDRNGKIDIVDIGIIVDHYGETGPVPTNGSSTATPSPRPATATPTASEPPISSTSGIWISPEEIMNLPMSGAAWTRVQSAANSSWGSANLGDNNSSHDVNTLAGALVAVRTGNSAMRSKTIAGLQSAMNSPLTRALELSRGLQTYVIAADIIGYRTPEFEAWVREMLNKNVSPHTGGSQLCNSSGVALSCSGIGGVVCTALRSANNWGGHARASAIASALYLNDNTLLNKLINAHKAFIGMDVPNNLYCENTNWHADSNNKYGVNKTGSTISGRDASGILPEDWRRGSEYKWPPTFSGYMWEGMQGYVVSAVMLQRSGDLAFSAGENAVVRSMNMLYSGINYPAGSDDTWIPWLVNYYANTNFPTGAAVSGKNMGWTDWTHQK